jgi:ring-1,2-phenylacetyl-CoA epoxidase subunit PaaD
MVTTTQTAWEVAAETPDPELPMLTLADLGILRAVEDEDGTTVAVITPTYSGCPALREISRDVVHRLHTAGYRNVRVRTQLAPAWSSDWITEGGRRKLAAAGIAPPQAAPKHTGPIPLTLTPRPTVVGCPRCGSTRTTQTAAFSATACKALYRCTDCAEPFEYVKAI